MKIISGGQIGADIAALRAAKELGFETGGWMPKGFWTKEGARPEYAEMYGMVETASDSYPVRTKLNVEDSDGTLRIAAKWNSPGEICTLNAINKYHRPHYDLAYVDVLAHDLGTSKATWIVTWLIENNIKTLNIAGNAVKEFEGPIERFIISMFRVNAGRLLWDSV